MKYVLVLVVGAAIFYAGQMTAPVVIVMETITHAPECNSSGDFDFGSYDSGSYDYYKFEVPAYTYEYPEEVET